MTTTEARIHPGTMTPAATLQEMCLDSLGATGACVLPGDHADAHRDANGYGWAHRAL